MRQFAIRRSLVSVACMTGGLRQLSSRLELQATHACPKRVLRSLTLSTNQEALIGIRVQGLCV